MNPVLVSTWGKPKKNIAAFFESTRRLQLNPQNADATDWGGDDWRTIEWFRKSQAQARFVREHAGEYSHWAFSDSYDVIFAANWPEIMQKFLAYKSPIVWGAESYPWPKTEQAPLYPKVPYRCKYLNAGFWMGETAAVLPFTAELERIASKREQDDQGICVDLFLSGKWPIVLDNRCELLFCMNVDSPKFLDLSEPRPRCIDTGTRPCCFHGNGGSDLSGVIKCLSL